MTGETKIPSNHVIGVIGPNSVEDVLESLHQGGFTGVLVMRHVEGTGEGVNPLMALVEKLTDQLSDETSYMDKYQEATKRGDVVVAVQADGEETERVRDILVEQGAVDVRFVGLLGEKDMMEAPTQKAPQPPREQGSSG